MRSINILRYTRLLKAIAVGEEIHDVHSNVTHRNNKYRILELKKGSVAPNALRKKAIYITTYSPSIFSLPHANIYNKQTIHTGIYILPNNGILKPVMPFIAIIVNNHAIRLQLIVASTFAKTGKFIK